MSRLFLRELLDWRKVSAILVGFFGVVVAVYPYRSSGSNAWIGVAACAVCVLCFSTVIAWSRSIAQQESPESMTFFSGLVAAILGLIAMLFYAAPVTLGLPRGSWRHGASGCRGKHLDVHRVAFHPRGNGLAIPLQPTALGALVAYLFFRETPTVWMLGGAVLIVASGLYIAMRKPGPTPALPHACQD